MVEVFERGNGTFREFSVKSNHLAPGRDIAVAHRQASNFSFLVSGGFLKSKADRDWRQAGPKVRQLFESSQMRRLLGLGGSQNIAMGKLDFQRTIIVL